MNITVQAVSAAFLQSITGREVDLGLNAAFIGIGQAEEGAQTVDLRLIGPPATPVAIQEIRHWLEQGGLNSLFEYLLKLHLEETGAAELQPALLPRGELQTLLFGADEAWDAGVEAFDRETGAVAWEDDEDKSAFDAVKEGE